jgi:formyl-CoA transferase
MYAATGVLAALRHAERTGEGQHIDVALFDCQIAMLANQASNYLVAGEAPGRLGNAHPNIAPYQVFETSDGHLVVAVGNDGQFKAFAEAIGAPHLSGDERFALGRSRVVNRAALIGEIAPRLKTRTMTHWFAALDAAGVPVGPIHTIAEVFADPQTAARQMTVRLARENEGEASYVPHPVKYSKTPARTDLAPPRLGAHTDEVLKEDLGLSAREIATLRNAGVVE